jgi:hypothetical protein
MKPNATPNHERPVARAGHYVFKLMTRAGALAAGLPMDSDSQYLGQLRDEGVAPITLNFDCIADVQEFVHHTPPAMIEIFAAPHEDVLPLHALLTRDAATSLH